jgi:hypothetical protein
MSNQNDKSPDPKKSLWRWLPIITALISLVIVAVVGIVSTPTDVYAQNPNATPGTMIAVWALLVSIIVFYLTKLWVDNKNAPTAVVSSMSADLTIRKPLSASNRLYVFGALVAIFAIFAFIVFVLGNMLGISNFQTDNATLGLRFGFVILGLLIAFAVYLFNKDNKAWEVGTREVVWMAIGAALYAVFSWYFNATVFVVPSLSQVALRPAIAIPMFFGYAFGPIVGFFTGAVGNMFGDAITGFGLSPQWSIGNGLVGFVAGLPALFANRKKATDTVMWVGGVLALLATVVYFLNRGQTNMIFYDPANNIFGDQPIAITAGISVLVGFVLVLIVRFAFGKNVNVAEAVIWSMLGNILGIGFAAISDIWINGFSPAAAVVGEFLPAAGPNLIFAAILVPLLVGAYAAVQKQSGR